MCNSNSFPGRTAGRRATHSPEWFQSPQRHAKLTGWVQRGEDRPASVPLFLLSCFSPHRTGATKIGHQLAPEPQA